MDFGETASGGRSLLWHLPNVNYFAKNSQGKFIAANSGFLEMTGPKTEAQLLGKSDFEIWPRFLAELYVKDDARVMGDSEDMVNKIELVLRKDRSADWFATTKIPVYDSQGRIVGVEGVCRYLKKAKAPQEPALKMPSVIDYLMDNYQRKIDIPTLAAMASLSVKQIERNFKKEYGTVPVRYIQRIRLDAARQMLTLTNRPIAQISRETGFYDISHFSSLFQKYAGLSPKAYRQRHLLREKGAKARS